jgi:hypothetical protein
MTLIYLLGYSYGLISRVNIRWWYVILLTVSDRLIIGLLGTYVQ